jgi:glycerol kinase
MTVSHGNILAIDQGTTNTKVLLVDARGIVIAQASRPMSVEYPHPAWVEQDPNAIWASVREAIDALDAQYPGLKARLVDLEENRLRRNIALVVDGVSSREGLRQKLAENSEVHFVPAISGGMAQAHHRSRNLC